MTAPRHPSPADGPRVSEHGARIAAGRLKITVDEYRRHEADGESWCTACRQWKPRDTFAANAGRVSGVANECRPCKSVIDAERYRYRVIAIAAREQQRRTAGISYAGPAFQRRPRPSPEGATVATRSSTDSAEVASCAQSTPTATVASSGHISCPAVLGCRDGRLPEGWVREGASL